MSPASSEVSPTSSGGAAHDFFERLAVAEKNDEDSHRQIQGASHSDLANVQLVDREDGNNPTQVEVTTNMQSTSFDFTEMSERKKLYTITLSSPSRKVGSETLTVVDGNGCYIYTTMFQGSGRSKLRVISDTRSEAVPHEGDAMGLDRLIVAEIALNRTPSLKTLATATYSRMSEGKALEPRYRARRFHSLRVVIAVETMDGQPVAKFTEISFVFQNSSIVLEIAPGVDAAAIALLGASLLADWSMAGASGALQAVAVVALGK